jgi:hypothetical protein
VFPLDPEALDGWQILLIVVAEDEPWTAAFVTGLAHWREGRLFVTCGQSPNEFEVRGTREALAGCDPTILPRIIVPQHVTTVLALAQGVDAYVRVFGTAAPPGALTLAYPFFGLAKNSSTGECILFQGPAEMLSAEDDVSPDPWAGEQWRPDDEEWNPDEGATEVDPNYDPRDETEIRPNVAFHLKEGSDVRALFRDLIARAVKCHDIMSFDAKNGVIPASIRFAWDTPLSDVEAVADWLRSQTSVVSAVPNPGGPLPPPNDK